MDNLNFLLYLTAYLTVNVNCETTTTTTRTSTTSEVTTTEAVGGINGWRTSTILILSVVVFFVLSNIICCGISINKIIEDRKTRKAKIIAKQKAEEFKKQKHQVKKDRFHGVVEMALTKDAAEKQSLLKNDERLVTGAVKLSPEELNTVLDQYGRNNATNEVVRAPISSLEYIDFNDASMDGYADRIFDPESIVKPSN